MKSIGTQIRDRREKLEMTRPQLARRLSISPAYLSHLENDSHVHLSERVTLRLATVLNLRLSATAVKRHNVKSARWYRAYRTKVKSAKRRADAYEATTAGVRDLLLQSQRRARANKRAA